MNPDFVALARACGAEGVRARGTVELVEAVQGALRRSGPTLVEAVDTDFQSARLTDIFLFER